MPASCAVRAADAGEIGGIQAVAVAHDAGVEAFGAGAVDLAEDVVDAGGHVSVDAVQAVADRVAHSSAASRREYRASRFAASRSAPMQVRPTRMPLQV
jgi:hypothetical protein